MTRAAGLWRLPPRWVRRVVLAPLVVLLALVVLPIGVLVAAFVGAVMTWLLPGRLRIVRAFWMALFYLYWDAVVIVVAFALWVGSGFGWHIRAPAFQRAHYVFAARMLDVLFWQVRWTLRLRIVVEDADLGGVLRGRPVVVASRHAGPGDSFILVHALLTQFDREPRIVLKDTLQWDPAIDVLLNRLPTQFVTPRAARPSDAPGMSDLVGDLARGLDHDDALLIFPEGGNVTPRRRLGRIEALRSAGRTELAAQAEQMANVMAPHAGGLLSALEAAPDAGVVFIGHTGLDRLVTVADIWRELPMDKQIVMKGWPVQPADVPQAGADQEAWLFDHWRRIDEWIADHQE
ncbi:1-acyl-sn-glycerol-3-phosphate acyltransferase [Cellulomonas palmilytica]|uniref:1-acyl-sn-glycerol-3-phosphate acyltransferase n=1 Tax=Cellulomonas palmilytica TaxID=2608402 RepID=UPI001F307204|nr:1-acyl-sn-glycerol-3-phosphate acyltransferase [Cellulomonas palmilytica]UJP40466.1 1-acyl-sn-glycerol-3-phosphate acyltransferase [Cellulomonas palmilytica]